MMMAKQRWRDEDTIQYDTIRYDTVEINVSSVLEEEERVLCENYEFYVFVLACKLLFCEILFCWKLTKVSK